MENENKDFLGEENENTLTPEEKVQADISAKIADAAAEVQDEIGAATTPEAIDEIGNEWAEAPAQEAIAEEKPEPVRVTIKRNSFILSLIGSALIGALILFFCQQIPSLMTKIPEGSKVVSVNGEEITDLDVNYYIYAQAMTYATQNGLSEEDIKNFDWDQEIDGVKLSDTIKEKALNDAINEVITIQKGAENGIVLDDASKEQLTTQLEGITASYGEDGFALRVRTMGIASIKQYAKMYEKVMTLQSVQEDISANPDKYYPEDENALNDYLQADKASVKHILIEVPETEDGTKDPAVAAEKLALAQSVLERAKAGEDFDALVTEFNQDPGATEEGYTFTKGEMVAEFETAAFGLKIGEISDIVETSYGYHIIKRIPGMYDLQGYWQATEDIKVNNGKFNKLSVGDIMADVFAAIEAVEAEESAAVAE